MKLLFQRNLTKFIKNYNNRIYFCTNKSKEEIIKESKWVKQEFKSLSSIPILIHPSHIFTVCGLLSGITLLFLEPKNIHGNNIPWPNYKNINNEKMNINYLKYSSILTITSFVGYLSGKFFFLRINLGNIDHRINRLVNLKFAHYLHSTAFPLVTFYGLMGLDLIFECIFFGEPIGFNEFYQKTNEMVRIDMEYASPTLKGNDKSFYQCSMDEIGHRFMYGMELLNLFVMNTYIPYSIIFFGGGSFFMLKHRKIWAQLYSKMAK